MTTDLLAESLTREVLTMIRRASLSLRTDVLSAQAALGYSDRTVRVNYKLERACQGRKLQQSILMYYLFISLERQRKLRNVLPPSSWYQPKCLSSNQSKRRQTCIRLRAFTSQVRTSAWVPYPSQFIFNKNAPILR
jgi:hypothetical protein